MRERALLFTMRYGRTVLLAALVALLLLVGATGEVAAHGPCHENPGNVPEMVCEDLPSREAPRDG